MPGKMTDILNEFCLDTTVHGISFASKQKSKFFKCFWSLVVLSGFAALSFHLYEIIYGYFQYKSTESIYERRNGFKFPDVTVCNLNGISFSNLKDAAENLTSMETFFETLVPSSDSMSQTTFVMPMKPQKLFWALGHEAKHIGHKLEDMILSCRFARDQCKEDDFVLYNFPEFI